MGKFRVGVIGCGGMGSHLARQCSTIESAQVMCLHDTNPEAAQKLADELADAGHSVQIAGGAKEVISGPVDGVIIATLNDTHAPLTIAAAEAGKHVFCEKPMAMSLPECDAMIEATDKAGVKLMVGQVLRLINVFWKSAEIVKSGELGAPFAMAVTRIGGITSLSQGWRATRKHSGGVLYEVHVHELDFMRHIMGEAKSVFASVGHFTESPVEFEDVAFVHVRYDSGGIGTLHCGVSSSIVRQGMMIQCEKGTLVINGFGGPIEYSRFGEEVTTIDASSFEKEEPYREEVRSWVEASTTGSPMVFDGRDGRSGIELVEAAYRSANGDEAVKLPLRA